MAKIVSPVWSRISGSIAGTTYLTTPAGQIIARQRTRPVQAPSVPRTAIRDAMTEAVSRWSAKTAAEKLAWDTWAAGNSHLKGREEFVAGQSAILYITNRGLNGITVVNDDVASPQFSGHPSMTLAPANFVTPAETGIAFQIKNTFSVESWFLIEISPALSSARNYWKGPWDASLTAAVKLTKSTSVIHTVQVPLPGQRFFVRVRSVSNGIGETPQVKGRVVSPPFIVFCTSVTNP